MYPLKVTRALLTEACAAAKNAFPLEFVALIGSTQNNEIIDEIVVVPAVSGDFHAIIYSHAIPFDQKIRGTIHSHPSKNSMPSAQDLQGFQKLGRIHLIVSLPFAPENIRAYDYQGRALPIEAVE